MKTTPQQNEMLAELRKRFDGEFMQPELEFTRYAEITDELGDKTCVPADVCDSDLVSDYEDYVPGEPCLMEKKEGWVYRLSASGYMDCTDWGVAKTMEEAIEALMEILD